MGFNLSTNDTVHFMASMARNAGNNHQDPRDIRWTPEELSESQSIFNSASEIPGSPESTALLKSYGEAAQALNNPTFMGLDGDASTLSVQDVIFAMQRDGNEENLTSEDMKVETTP